MVHRANSLEEYRRRRHRSALLRRGRRTGLPPPCCTGTAGEVRVFPLLLRRSQPEIESSLWMLACRVSAYPGVQGLLYRRRGDRILVRIVAPRPMTEPMRILADVWSLELDLAWPGTLWRISVVEAPPADAEDYRCLFWRRG